MWSRSNSSSRKCSPASVIKPDQPDLFSPAQLAAGVGAVFAQRTRSATQSRVATWLALVLACLLSGCSTLQFYRQAARGQLQMLARQKPVSKWLARPETPAPLASRLRLAQEICAFAEQELGLPANGHYQTYADLGRPFAVWNVYAAPEFSLEAKSWWYPVVGRLTYRGFFREADARRLAARLALRGHDVYVGGVTAYSTLGWFRDPLLNTFILDDETDLAELLFHELAHQRLFKPGETDFNEAFATAVAEEGLQRWLKQRGSPAALAEFLQATQRKAQFIQLLTQARQSLETLYRLNPTGDAQSPAELRRAKEAAFDQLRTDYAALKQSWGGRDDFDGWFRGPLNNARLNTVDTYYGRVPEFRQLLAGCSNDLPQFYRAAERLAETPKH